MIVFSVLLFVSGAAALIYQVVWVRQLLLIVGTTAAAVTTVLSVFMAGLGLGAWLFGAAADQSRVPLRLYGYLEIGIGLYALLLPVLIAASMPPYVGLARHLAGQPDILLPVRVVLGFLLLLVPTVLMGGTLPVLVRHVARSLERFGADLGILYSMNLMGGVAGSLAAGFALIHAFGVQGASVVAAAGNLGVGLAALLLARRGGAAAAAPARVMPASAVRRLEIPGGVRPLVWSAVFFSGLLSMGFEILWTRILVFTLGSTVYAFTVILATFLAGLALGGWLFVALEGRVRPLPTLATALLAAGIAALALAPVSTRSQDVIAALSLRFGWTGDVFLAGTAVCAALVVLAPATLMGLVLPLSMRLLVDDLTRAGGRVGSAYLVNTAGCVLGSLLTGFALIPLLELKGTLLLLAGIQLALGAAFILRVEPGGGRRLRLLVPAAALAVAGFLVTSQLLRGPNPFDPALREAEAPAVEVHHDGIGASVSVLRYPNGVKTLRIDGFEASSNKVMAGYMPMMTHIPALLHPDPLRILVICFGTGATAGAGLLYPGAVVDVVDINRTVFAFAPHFRGVNHGVARDPRAHLIVDDGRNFLLTTRQRYDVITAEPMPPNQAGVVNLYSKEFYELARERLTPGGLVVQWLPMHLLAVDESLQILRTVQAVFPETTLWLHGDTGIIVARRDGPIRIDLARVARALTIAPLRDELGELGVRTPLDFAKLYALSPDEIRALTSSERPVTDDRPSLEFHRLRHPLQEFHGAYNEGHARTMRLIWRSNADSVPPVVDASPAQVAELAEARKLASRQGLADLQRYWKLGS
jgi:predicted membrane-bound spermidine synthase